MPEILDEEQQQAEDPIQSASPGGPCDICFNCGACNPDNMSEFTVDVSKKLPTDMGDKAKDFVGSNMPIFQAMPEGNIHNVQIGNLLVSGFKTSSGELRLNMTDKFSPEIVSRQGSDYLNPDTAPAPKVFNLADAKSNPEMQARFREEMRRRRSSTQPEIKKENKPAQSIQPEQPTTPVVKDYSTILKQTQQPDYQQQTPDGVLQPLPKPERHVSHIENTDPLLVGSDNKSEKTAVTPTSDHHMDQPSVPKNLSYTAGEKTTQSSHTEAVTSSSKPAKKESSVNVQTDTPPASKDILSKNPIITAVSVEPKPSEEILNTKPEATQSLSQKNPLDTEHISNTTDTSEKASPLPFTTEQPVVVENARPEITQLVQTHTEAIRALFDFMTILTQTENTMPSDVSPISEKNNKENTVATQPENETLQIMEFPDHSAAVVKQFLIGAEAQRTNISGVLEIAKDTTTHESNSIHEEVFIIESEGQTWTIRLIEEKDKPVKIIAPKAAMRIVKERLQKYLRQAGSEVDEMELVSEEENQNNYVSLSLGYTDDTLLFWLCYLQLKAAFLSGPWELEKTHILTEG